MYGKCECFVMQMLYVCVFCGSSILVLLLFNIKLFSVFFYNSVPKRLLNFLMKIIPMKHNLFRADGPGFDSVD